MFWKMMGEELLHIQLSLYTSWIQILFDEQLFIKSRPGNSISSNLKMKRTENFFALTLLSLHWIEGIWIANFTWARHYLFDALHYNLKTKQETTLKVQIILDGLVYIQFSGCLMYLFSLISQLSLIQKFSSREFYSEPDI